MTLFTLFLLDVSEYGDMGRLENPALSILLPATYSTPKYGYGDPSLYEVPKYVLTLYVLVGSAQNRADRGDVLVKSLDWK